MSFVVEECTEIISEAWNVAWNCMVLCNLSNLLVKPGGRCIYERPRTQWSGGLHLYPHNCTFIPRGILKKLPESLSTPSKIFKERRTLEGSKSLSESSIGLRALVVS